MSDITYFHRNRADGFSILKVSRTFIDEIYKHTEIDEFFVPHKGSLHPLATIKNMYFVLINRNTKGINHITGDIHFCVLSLLGCKSLLTVHDTYSVERSNNPIKQIIRNQLYYKWCIKLATQVVCISEKTKDDLLKCVKLKNVVVIYNAVSPMFKFNSKPFNEEKPVILQIGTSWNKNLYRMIKAIAGIPCELRIIGKIDDQIIAQLNKENISYSTASGLSDEEIVMEYENCDIVSFCSIFEGFGMPIIEANAVGRCVITSNFAPMTEVANDAACFVDPYDVSDIAKGLRKIVTDPVYRQILIENGKKNTTRFNKDIIAEQYSQLYKKILKGE